jgi:hypothetical protein
MRAFVDESTRLQIIVRRTHDAMGRSSDRGHKRCPGEFLQRRDFFASSPSGCCKSSCAKIVIAPVGFPERLMLSAFPVRIKL